MQCTEKESEGTRQYSSMLKKNVSEKEDKAFSLYDRADKARISGLDCRKGIQTGYKNKTLIRNSEI